MNDVSTKLTTLFDEVYNLLLTDFSVFFHIPILVSILCIIFRVIARIMDCGISVGTFSSFSHDTDGPDLEEEKLMNQWESVTEPEHPDPPVKVLSRHAFVITCPNCGASVSGDSKQCAYCDSYFQIS